MEEFKEDLIRRYIQYVYEGKEIVKFWTDNNFHLKTNTNDNKVNILIKQCLKHNVDEFIKTSYVLHSIFGYYEMIMKITNGLDDMPENYNIEIYMYNKLKIMLDDYIPIDIDEKDITKICCQYNNNVNLFILILKSMNIDNLSIII